MVETAEGIGGRKWELARNGATAETEIKEGVNTVALVRDRGVLHLLVTAPELWDAANDLLRTWHDDKSADVEFANALDRLSNMVAKAVGKTSWSDVAQ